MYKNGLEFTKQQIKALEKLRRLEKDKKKPTPSAKAMMPVTYGTTPSQDKMRIALELLGAGQPHTGGPQDQ